MYLAYLTLSSVNLSLGEEQMSYCKLGSKDVIFQYRLNISLM